MPVAKSDSGRDVLGPRDQWPVHPAWEHREQEAEKHRRKNGEQHQVGVRPDRCGLQCQRKNRRARRAGHQVQAPPRAGGQQADQPGEEQCPVRCSQQRTSLADGRVGCAHEIPGTGGRGRGPASRQRAPSRTPAVVMTKLNAPGQPVTRPSPAPRLRPRHAPCRRRAGRRTARAAARRREDRVARHAHPDQQVCMQRLLHELGRARVPVAVLDRGLQLQHAHAAAA